MTKYIDDYNGVWEYSDYNGDHPWRLLSTGLRHTFNNMYKVDSWYTHKEAKKIGDTFTSLDDGKQFDFPATYSKGDQVWVDMEWLYANGTDYMRDYMGSPCRIGGEVKNVEYADPGHVIVTVAVRVPETKLTKK